MNTSRFVHAVTISHPVYDEDALDEYGQPTATRTTIELQGLIQPRGAREDVDHRSAGTEIADHVIFLPIDAPISAEDAIIRDDERYEIIGIRRFDFGRLQHLEVDARRIAAVPVVGTPGAAS